MGPRFEGKSVLWPGNPIRTATAVYKHRPVALDRHPARNESHNRPSADQVCLFLFLYTVTVLKFTVFSYGRV